MGDNPVEVRIFSAALCVFRVKIRSNQCFDCSPAVCNFSELRIDVSDGEGAAEIATDDCSAPMARRSRIGTEKRNS